MDALFSVWFRVVEPVAAREAPRKTGALSKSVKARASQRTGALKAGTKARVPYGPPIHWGWKKRNIDPNELIQLL